MTEKWYRFLILSVAIGHIYCFKDVTRENEEAVYTWTADVKAGTHLPTSFASQFALRGKIHLQSRNGSTFLKITDLTYHIYNGVIDNYHEHQTRDVPVPPDADDLGKVFKIVYDDDGLVEGIVTEDDEKEFSRNIKKAIATIFQMNATVLGKEYHHPEAFVTQENSIYGHGSIDYTIFPRGKGMEIHKLHDMSNADEIFSYFSTNTEPVACGDKTEEMVMHDSKKIYYVTKQNDHYAIKSIIATGSVVYYPFEAKSAAQIILVNQTFHLSKVVPVQEEYHTKNENIQSSLTYNPFVTNGQSTVDYAPVVAEMLKEVPKYLEEDHITSEVPDTKRGQLVNRIQSVLLTFSTEKLHELQKTLPDDALSIFYKIVPLVRTDDSTIFIKNLIVDKTVNEDVAVEMLKHMTGNSRPWQNLLPKLEELIHLDETYSWVVRKTGIISFGTLIHKSYVFAKRHRHDLQYEKYVTEYISKLRNSDDYETQFAYVMGLRNMNLPILARKLVPAVNGEWWHNQHLRFMSMWAASLSSDSNTAFEILWPIVTNKEELAEMKIFAFWLILQTKPSESQLKNIFTYVLAEKDHEVYRFFYTYLETVEKSKNPCIKDFSLRASHLLKFAPSPQRGISYANLFGYVDNHYGFGFQVENYFYIQNESRIYATYLQNQQHNMFHNDYVFYLKIHDGRGYHPGIIGDPLSDLVSVVRDLDKEEKLHVEGVIVQGGHVAEMFYFDETTIRDWNFLEFFKEKNITWSKQLLNLDYDRYHRGLIATDLGIPAFWEYLMPDVSQNNVALSKSVSDEGLEVQIDYRYANWKHYRHGLSFYNPVSDIWQGINRYHSFDSSLPLRLHAVINFENGILDLSWKKHKKRVYDVLGFRTYVKQSIFVRNDYEETLIDVTGKNYTHKYQLINIDDSNSGYKWYSSIFNSSVYYTYGAFQNRLSDFFQHANKYFVTLMQYLPLVLDDLVKSGVHLVRDGNYGFVVRGEPSATDINLSLRFAQKIDKSHLLEGRTWFTNLTYCVKHQNQEARIWDLNTTVDVKPGHQFASLYVDLARKESNKYRISAAGSKTWTTEEIRSVLNITGENDAAVNISIVGKRSQAQLEGDRKYGSCHHLRHFSWPQYHSMECLVDHSTVRHYTYDIKYKNTPSEAKSSLRFWWGHVKSRYQSYAWYPDADDSTSDDGNIKIEIEYPVEGNELGVNITAPDHTYELSGVPTRHLHWYGLVPESLVYPKMFLDFYKDENLDYCTIFPDHFSSNKDLISEVVPQEWTLYVADNNGAVYIKRVEDNIAIKVASGEHFLEVFPGDGTCQISQDGQAEQNHRSWVYCQRFAKEHGQLVVVFLRRSLIHIEYDMNHVVVLVPKKTEASGRCYRHRQ